MNLSFNNLDIVIIIIVIISRSLESLKGFER